MRSRVIFPATGFQARSHDMICADCRHFVPACHPLNGTRFRALVVILFSGLWRAEHIRTAANRTLPELQPFTLQVTGPLSSISWLPPASVTICPR